MGLVSGFSAPPGSKCKAPVWRHARAWCLEERVAREGREKLGTGLYMEEEYSVVQNEVPRRLFFQAQVYNVLFHRA